MGSGYLQSTVNLQKCCNECCGIMGSGYLRATLNLQKCCNQCRSIPWVVDTWNLQLKCKNVLIKARAVASGEGGWGGGSCPHRTCWARQIKFVDGFVFFWLYWLAIVCHFHGREISWSTVCASSKQTEAKAPITIFLTTPVGSVSCERSSLSTLRRLNLWTRSSMTKEGLSGVAFHRGTNYMPKPKHIYERKSNLTNLL